MAKQKQNLVMTVLGCGSSGGVPRVGGDWGACDPTEPKNRRRRSSIIMEYWQGDDVVPQKERTIVLIDTAPDLREQLLDANILHIDAVLYTHDHGDQTHGMDDLRAIAYLNRTQIPVYMDAATRDDLTQRFQYCFEKPAGRIHPPILRIEQIIKDQDQFSIDGPGGHVDFEVFQVGHGSINAMGFKMFDRYAYTPDVHTIDEAVINRLRGIDLWILDALRYHKHPTHAHADKALRWGAQAACKKLVFTNLHIDLDYRTFQAELPGIHEPAYDGMVLSESF